MKISDMFEKVIARQILDSRGAPTVEVELHSVIGVFRDSCPSGASTGSMEAKVILDRKGSYGGRGVRKAIFNIEKIIAPRLGSLSMKVSAQKDIDDFLCDLDGTSNKKRLGANAILPISLAFARAGAVYKDLSLREYIAHAAGTQMSLPRPFFNVINGGMHSGNGLAFQELMVAFFYDTYSENLEQAVLFYAKLREAVVAKYGAISAGTWDEGGFAPPVGGLDEALALLVETYKKNDFGRMRIAIDSAANSFYEDGTYNFEGRRHTGPEFVDFYAGLVEKYPLIFSLEDPFAETDHASWKALHSRLAGRVKIVGDDLTVTNGDAVQCAAREGLCDTLLVKINQVGTVSEAIEAVSVARAAGMCLMVSHRSGETEDTFVCDFAVGIGAEYIKAGAPCRGERVAKYNQLLRIEASMRDEARD